MTRALSNTEKAFWDKINALTKAGYQTKIVDGQIWFRRAAVYDSDGGWTEARPAVLVGLIPSRYI